MNDNNDDLGQPFARRRFLINAGSAVALSSLSGNLLASAAPPVRPPDGLPDPVPTTALPVNVSFHKPPAPFTLVDFDRNPFQRPLGARFEALPLPQKKVSPQRGPGVTSEQTATNPQGPETPSAQSTVGDQLR